MENKNKVIGYVFKYDGKYDKKYYFKDTPENIANFIWQHRQYPCTVTDTADNLIVSSTYGGFLDHCVDQKYLANKLLPALLPLQLGEQEEQPLDFKENEYSYEQTM